MLKNVSTHVSPFHSLNRSSRQAKEDAGPPLTSHTPKALRTELAEAAAAAEASPGVCLQGCVLPTGHTRAPELCIVPNNPAALAAAAAGAAAAADSEGDDDDSSEADAAQAQPSGAAAPGACPVGVHPPRSVTTFHREESEREK